MYLKHHKSHTDSGTTNKCQIISFKESYLGLERWRPNIFYEPLCECVRNKKHCAHLLTLATFHSLTILCLGQVQALHKV